MRKIIVAVILVAAVLFLVYIFNQNYVVLNKKSLELSGATVIGTQGAIFGTNYFWADSMAISTTAIDTAFDEQWQNVTLWSSGANLWLKSACNNDTSGFSSAEYIYLLAGQAINFGTNTKLKRVAVKASAGTGVLYMAGYKKTAQY